MQILECCDTIVNILCLVSEQTTSVFIPMQEDAFKGKCSQKIIFNMRRLYIFGTTWNVTAQHSDNPVDFHLGSGPQQRWNRDFNACVYGILISKIFTTTFMRC